MTDPADALVELIRLMRSSSALLVGQHFGVGQAGVVVDGDVHVVPADAALLDRLAAAVRSPAPAGRDAAFALGAEPPQPLVDRLSTDAELLGDLTGSMTLLDPLRGQQAGVRRQTGLTVHEDLRVVVSASHTPTPPGGPPHNQVATPYRPVNKSLVGTPSAPGPNSCNVWIGWSGCSVAKGVHHGCHFVGHHQPRR